MIPPQLLPRLALVCVQACLFAISLSACSPSINPKLKTSVDAHLSAAPSLQVLGADADPVGYQPGQWLRYKIVDSDGQPSIMTYKLLATDGYRHSIETISESYYFRTVSYMDIEYRLDGPLKDLKILRVITMDDQDSKPQQANSFDLSMMGSMYRSLAGHLFHKETSVLNTSEVAVAAGVFAGCSEKDTTLRFGPIKYKTRTWHHPGVPMHGMVKAEPHDGDKGRTELIAYGLTGARSEIRRLLSHQAQLDTPNDK